MRAWEIEQRLQDVPDFSTPKAQYEQYITPPHLASQLTQLLGNEECIEDASVCDLGCGTGMLTLAATLAGAAHVVGVDVDDEALRQARENVAAADFVRADVVEFGAMAKRFDFVVTNPPFGTKRRGVDMAFLKTAINMANVAVLSMHKSSTREFIRKRFVKYGVVAEPIAQLRFQLGNNYRFHRAGDMDVDVDLWRFDVVHATHVQDEIRVERPVEVVGDFELNSGRRARFGKRGRGRGRGRRR